MGKANNARTRSRYLTVAEVAGQLRVSNMTGTSRPSTQRQAEPSGETQAVTTEAMVVVSLLTDYGLADGFVGTLHSVLRRAAPAVPVVDLTHAIARQDVRAGSLALLRAAPYLAPGIVVAIVDPGVGTTRRGVAVQAAGGTGLVGGRGEPAGGAEPASSGRPVGDKPTVVFVGPDNGLLPPAVDALGGPSTCVELEDRGYWLPAPGPTFAGRDIFAPAAARLACGAKLSDLGPPIAPETLVRLAPPMARHRDGGALEAEVTWVDGFGNVQLAAGPADLAGVRSPSGPPGDGDRTELEVAGTQRTFTAANVRVFADLAPNQLGLLVDSYGQLAVVLNGASAADHLGAREGEVLILRPPG
jgi:S-adenosylmethionine hydrolase